VLRFPREPEFVQQSNGPLTAIENAGSPRGAFDGPSYAAHDILDVVANFEDVGQFLDDRQRNRPGWATTP
jgi:hypothetical protein